MTNIDRFGSLNGKTILYTGAAGGLGHGAVLHFLKAGAKIIVLDNDQAKTQALEQAANAQGLEGLRTAQIDLSDLAALEKLLVKLSNESGGFDVVINNAAIYPSKPFEDYSMAEIQLVQRVNVDAGILCVKAALPHMKKSRWGRIINIASITLYGGWASLAPYVQSKGALIGLTRAWAREFGEAGITSNAVSPGAFPTDAEKIHPNPEEYERYVLEHQAIKRRGTPADIANVLMFLASDASAFVTGQTINVDGGWVMQ